MPLFDLSIRAAHAHALRCHLEWNEWIQNPLYNEESAWLPEFICAAGSACIRNASDPGMSYVALYRSLSFE